MLLSLVVLVVLFSVIVGIARGGIKVIYRVLVGVVFRVKEKPPLFHIGKGGAGEGGDYS